MRYEVQTSRTPEEVKNEALSFFGEGGLGLTRTGESPDSVTFSGGGGYVSISIEKKAENTLVLLETREWDYQVQEFMKHISTKSWW